MSPTHVFFTCHQLRMMVSIKESLPLWACNLMQIRATDCQMSAAMVQGALLAGNTVKLHASNAKMFLCFM